MLSLYLDTTHATLMMALGDAHGLIARRQHDETDGAYASSLLLPQLMEMLQETSSTLQNLGRVVVNIGPGSFTGIRTGVSVARLLGQFMPVEILGVSAFEILAAAEPYRGQTVTVILDAFRQQHARATLRIEEHGQVRWLREPEIFKNAELQDSDMTAHVVLVGPTLKSKLPPLDTLLTWLDENPVFTPDPMAFLAHMAPQIYKKAWHDCQPFYLQQPHVTVAKLS